MSLYELADYSGRKESLIKLCEYPKVTLDNIDAIKEIISYIQLPLYQVQEGDNLTIYIVDNRIEEIMGFLAIWRNKGIACLNLGTATEWGTWQETDRVFMTEEFEAGSDENGAALMGRIAYNGHGIRGIYSKGSFYRLLGNASDIQPFRHTSLASHAEQIV